MIYPNNFEEKLGFDKIREKVRKNTLCPLGAERVDNMTFLTDKRALQHELDLLQEMTDLLEQALQPLPTDYFFDLTLPLKRIKVPGTFLETEELYDLMRSLRTIDNLVRYLQGFENGIPLLKEQASQVVTHRDIVMRIDQTLTPEGEIKDNASPALAEIRHEMARTMSGIGRLLNNILRNAQAEGLIEKDTTPTMRDGRLMIPIPPSSKRKLKGIVHDESATGKTLYVEPAEVVEANNRIRELEGEERQEIIRILTQLTGMIRPEADNMLAAYDFLGLIDFLRAKARFAETIDGITPRLSETNTTDWVQARHPLLYIRYAREGKTVVPLDILLDHKKQRIVLISGPNAGGKSVCLETLGLVQYMLQHGLPVPMKDNSECAIFDHIFVDIGDEQSIDNDLSTYSSHLQNMKFFLRNANGYRPVSNNANKPAPMREGSNGTLVLIDEFGSGTEPQIGGAIAQAILGKLNKMHVNGVITTHFTNLKLFADETQGIVNGAMLYDRGEMRPLFRLEIGRPGSSFAIEIAHKIGLPNDVIATAKEIVGSDYVNMDKYLQDISRDKRYWEQKRQKIHQQEKELEEKSLAYDEKTAQLKQKKQEVMQQARNEAESLLKEANARIERTIKEIKEAQADKETTKKIRQEHKRFVEQKIEKRKREEEEKQKQAKPSEQANNTPIAVGDTVRIKGQSTMGEVMAISGRQCKVAFGMISSMVDMSRLERMSKNQQKKAESGKFQLLAGTHDPSVSDEIRQRRLAFKAELDVRGMRAEEALQSVMYFLDDAQLLSIAQVRILHGTGTGALRVAIRQYLGTRSCVANFRDEHVQFGGAGVTIVELE
ncbi:MAG: endonuclease MutS2 [Bacteroidales bacterium]|nr:endonuclease MutS2 [Bacteroidales bacterium]